MRGRLPADARRFTGISEAHHRDHIRIRHAQEVLETEKQNRKQRRAPYTELWNEVIDHMARFHGAPTAGPWLADVITLHDRMHEGEA